MLSVIMPAYNKSQSLGKTVMDAVATLQRYAPGYEIIIVDDGSTDGTSEVGQSLAEENPAVRTFSYRENRGRGYALRYGFERAKGDLVVMIDADSDLPPAQIPRLLAYMEETGADVINGSKRHPESKLAYPLNKKIISWGYNIMVRVLFRLPLKDTLTGLKLFKHKVLREVFSRAETNGFALNLELLFHAHRLGYKIIEVPVEIRFAAKSTVNLRSILKVCRETLAIFYRSSYVHHPRKAGTGLRVAMVADYPQKDATHSNAKAPYAKNLVLALKENDVRLTIIANRLEGSRNAYAEKGVRIVRCWQKGLFCLFQIVRQLWRLRAEIDVIHFQHEYFYYGGAVTAALFPFMLLLLKVLGKPILVTLHGVISISDFGGTFARQNRLKGNPRLLMSGLLIVTKLMGLFADRLIVHEDFLADTLAQEYGIKRKKIRTIHHGIQEGLPGDGAEIRKRLEINGRKALLFFGYFSGYKGLHILIDAFTKLEDRNTMLIVAGEENPRMTADRSYRAYIRRLKSQAATLGDRIAFVGFVPEKEMPMYFAAADVVVLPYTSVVSACGPLTQCVTYRRPFLLSEPFEKVVSRHAFLFKAEPELLRRKIEEFFADGKLAKEALDCAEKLARERSWGESGRQTAGIYRELCSK